MYQSSEIKFSLEAVESQPIAGRAPRRINVICQVATYTLTLPSGKLIFCTEPLVKSPRVISDLEILGGTPVFIGTRVPVRIIFEHLVAGDSLEVFLEDFPSVSRELAIQVLEDAKMALVLNAHPA